MIIENLNNIGKSLSENVKYIIINYNNNILVKLWNKNEFSSSRGSSSSNCYLAFLKRLLILYFL